MKSRTSQFISIPPITKTLCVINGKVNLLGSKIKTRMKYKSMKI
jgi:hypothetical protein